MKKVLIAGYYGFHNTGDEAVLEATLQRLRLVAPGCTACVLSNDPAQTERNHSVPSVPWTDIGAILSEMVTSELVLLMGGILHDYWGVDTSGILTPRHSGLAYCATIAILAGVLGKNLVLYGAGIGPLSTEVGRYLAKAVAEQAFSIVARDPQSLEELKAVSARIEEPVVTADPAFAMHQMAREAGNEILRREWGHIPARPLVGLAIRNWDVGINQGRWLAELSQGMRTYLRRHGGSVVLLPMQRHVGALTDDYRICQDVSASIGISGRVHCLESEYGPSAMAALFGACDAVVTMRYHGVVFSHLAGVPVVGLAYDPKVSNLLIDHSPAEKAILLADLEAAQLAAALDDAIAATRAEREAILARARAMRERSEKGDRALSAAFGMASQGRPLSPGLGRLVAALLLSRTESEASSEAGSVALATALEAQRLEIELLKKSLTAAQASKERLESAVETARIALSRGFSTQASGARPHADIEAMAEQANSRLVELSTAVDKAYGSRGWRLLLRLWAARARIAPLGSTREKLLGLAKHGDSPSEKPDGSKAGLGGALRAARRELVSFGRRLVPGCAYDLFDDLAEEYAPLRASRTTLFVTCERILPEYRDRRLLGHNHDSHSNRLGVTLVSTVKNEASAVDAWFACLERQTRPPDEVVIVDGGSTDGTVEALRKAAARSSIPVRVIPSEGVNIAAGRNLAVSGASNALIASTDFGCAMDPRWLELLTTPFEIEPEVEVSAGFYRASRGSGASTVYSALFVPSIEHMDPGSFLPSSRSIAFRKSNWASAGGYPEWLTDAGEDTLFALELARLGRRWAFVPEALVEWHGPRSLWGALRTAHRYAKGDGEARLFSRSYLGKGKRVVAEALLLVPLLASVALLSHFLPMAMALGASIAGLLLIEGIRWIGRLGRFSSIRGAALSPLVACAQLLGFLEGMARRDMVDERNAHRFYPELHRILSEHANAKGVVVYLPTHSWALMQQRPHHIARALARMGYLFFFCDLGGGAEAPATIREEEPNLYVSTAPVAVFRRIPKFILYIGSARHARLARRWEPWVLLYDHYDDIAVSSARTRDHTALLREANVVLVSSTELLRRVRAMRPDAVLVPNGADTKGIAERRAETGGQVPLEIADLVRSGRRIVGYSGALAEWIDYDLLRSVALAGPDICLVLVGIDYDGSLAASGLLDCAGVRWLGVRDHEMVIDYVACFDVGLVPFKINRVTVAASPIKLFEYAACGIPIVSTNIPEAARYPAVLIAAEGQSVVWLLREALERKGDPRRQADLAALAAANTWETRAASIESALKKAQSRQSEVR